jgi:tetratricopeptide (TPR) repeat protein
LHIGRHLYFQCIQSQYRAVCQVAKEDLQAAFAASDIHSYETCQFFRAWALLHLGQWSEMLAVLRDGEQMADRNQYPVWTMIFRLEKAWLYLQVGDWAHARELGEQGLAQALDIKHQYGQLLGCILLGWVHLGMEEWERASHYFNNVNYRPKRILMDWILRMPLCLGLSEYWLRQEQFARAGQAAQQLCTLAAQPGERTYLALGRRMLAEIALIQGKWDEAETELAQAIAVLEGAEAPLAEWRVYETAARLHDQRRRKSEADQCWTHSAVVLQGLADLLGNEAELHHSLLTHPSVRTIFSRARSSSLS